MSSFVGGVSSGTDIPHSDKEMGCNGSFPNFCFGYGTEGEKNSCNGTEGDQKQCCCTNGKQDAHCAVAFDENGNSFTQCLTPTSTYPDIGCNGDYPIRKNFSLSEDGTMDCLCARADGKHAMTCRTSPGGIAREIANYPWGASNANTFTKCTHHIDSGCNKDFPTLNWCYEDAKDCCCSSADSNDHRLCSLFQNPAHPHQRDLVCQGSCSPENPPRQSEI